MVVAGWYKGHILILEVQERRQHNNMASQKNNNSKNQNKAKQIMKISVAR